MFEQIPFDKPVNDFDIFKIVDDYDGLTVFIRDGQTSSEFSMFFKDRYGYSCFDEADLHKTWLDVGHLTCGLYESSNSELLQWATAQSPLDELPFPAKHYLLISMNDVVSVITDETPKIEITKS
ncbi:hypothetical protein [Parasphingorhabdus sp.]|uniref:hypothetical protein n=1 Tax=Parasphingorhabdus sp. TaxID=2709688 RepID=UPI003D2A3C5C